jgi:hypothetical protein
MRVTNSGAAKQGRKHSLFSGVVVPKQKQHRVRWATISILKHNKTQKMKRRKQKQVRWKAVRKSKRHAPKQKKKRNPFAKYRVMGVAKIENRNMINYRR